MQRLKRVFTSRSTVVTVLILFALAICIPLAVPQMSETAASAAWQKSYPGLAQIASWVGLDRVYTTWWFLALAGTFIISLLVSSWDQYLFALRKTRQAGAGADPGVRLAGSREVFVAALRSRGYLPIGGDVPGSRLVRNPWGYWGSFLLHLGLSLTVLCALVYVGTEHRVLLRAIQGEEIYLAGESFAEEKGVLAGKLPLPAAVRLDSFSPSFWDNDQLRGLASEITFLESPGTGPRLAIGINDNVRYRGMLVYQRNRFGTAFLLRLVDPRGNVSDEVLYLQQPGGRRLAGYGEASVGAGRYTLKGKYFADTKRQTVLPVNPELTVRLLEGAIVLGEAGLKPGEGKKVGPYWVTLEKVRWWGEYVLDGGRGTAGIFAGFGLILFGVVLTYFATPCVVTLREEGGKLHAFWSTARFNDLLKEERDRVVALARKEDSDE